MQLNTPSASSQSSHHHLDASPVRNSPLTVPSMLSSSSKSDSSFEILPESTNFESSTRRSNLPCYLIKPHTRNRRFWPREEAIKAIENALLPPPDKPLDHETPPLRTFVLYGMGGVGKTEVATEFVFKHEEKFDAIFFLHVEERSRLASEFIRVAELLGLEGCNDAKSAEEAVKEWLANPIMEKKSRQTSFGSFRSGADPSQADLGLAKWLIVFDNADDPEILLKFWPHDAHGSILVTSRDPMAKDEDYFGDTGLMLRELSNDEGAALLRNRTGTENIPDSLEAAKTITARLDGLPLAIEQIAAIIRRNGLSLQGFLDVYQEDIDLEALHDQRIAKKRSYEHSIASVWALQDLPAGSLALLYMMSFLDPDRIETRLLSDNLAAGNAESYPKSGPGFVADLTRLVQSTIVSRSSDGTEIRVHRLVQDVARAQMRKANVIETFFDNAVNLIWTDFPRITRGGVGRAQKIDRWDKCEQLFPHVTRLRDFYSHFPGDKQSFKSRARFADLLNEAGWYQFERTNPTDTLPVVELAQKICEESNDDHTEQLALIFGTRTWSSVLTKNHEMAYHFAKERLEMEQILFARTGVVTANLAAAYNDKAAAYSMNGVPSKAFELLYKSKELRESMPAFKPEHNFSPFHELSLAHYHLGEFEKAADCLQKAMRERIAALGENDRQSVRTGQLFYALGNVKSSQGKLDESGMWHQKALLHYRATAGNNHYKTACSCYRVAEHCIRSRNYEPAREFLNQALKVFQDRSYYRQEYSRTCFLYHELYKLDGNAIEARDMLDSSVKTFNTAFPQLVRTAVDLNADDFRSLCTYDF